MKQAVWSGAIAFGLVSIPVRLYPATEPKDVRFHLYDRSGRRVRYRRVVEGGEPPDPGLGPPVAEVEPPDGVDQVAAEADDATPAGAAPRTREREHAAAPVETETEIEWGDVSHGVEDELGRVVLLERDELERARPQRSRTIDVEDFVELRDIDPVHFEKSYVIAPASRDAVRPYVLLQRALERTGRVGIGRFVLRTKPHLVAIRPTRGVLALETLFFGDEVRDVATLVPGLDAVEVGDRELELAERLVETLETTWNPDAYADTYREELLRMLAEKTPAEPPATASETAPAAGFAVEELMRALRESVEAAKQRTAPAKKRSRRAAG